ncbi:hypothetical protein NHP194022_14010 [Helicobacter suis]|nr:hypothetical protein NHP194022_14010 [Helicobacter suis]
MKNINKNIVFPSDNRKTIAYARVSSSDQKDDLIRQVQVLELYCSKLGLDYEVITDLGSGMNYYKKGLTKLLNLILRGQVKRLVLPIRIDCCALELSWVLAFVRLKKLKLF